MRTLIIFSWRSELADLFSGLFECAGMFFHLKVLNYQFLGQLHDHEFHCFIPPSSRPNTAHSTLGRTDEMQLPLDQTAT